MHRDYLFKYLTGWGTIGEALLMASLATGSAPIRQEPILITARAKVIAPPPPNPKAERRKMARVREMQARKAKRKEPSHDQ